MRQLPISLLTLLFIHKIHLALSDWDADGLIIRIKRNYPDWEPNAIIDVGANYGDWSRGARQTFPSAKILMMEGSFLHNVSLIKAVEEIKNAEFIIGVVSATEETVGYYQGGNTGNSMFQELSKHYANDKPVLRQTRTLDSQIANSFLKNEVIDIIKADVQGAELMVFQGGTRALSRATFVLFEASTIQYNKGAPCTYEIDAFLRSHGYYLYDMDGINRNMNAFKTAGTGQYDLLYIRPDSPRLPKELKESGAKFCGHGRSNETAQTRSLERKWEDPEVNEGCVASVDIFSIWAAGFTLGVVATATLMRISSKM